jgi:phage protein D
VIGRRKIRGRALILGDPSVKLGDAIRLKGLPDSSLDGAYQVRSVTHRITKVRGFTTAVEFRAISQ